MKKATLGLILIALVSLALPAQEVVASTAWTAAFAQVAGADDVHVLAPFDLAHPPEYELRPSDIRTIMNASFVIYAGYENMVPRMVEAAGSTEATTIQIQTVHSVPAIRASVEKIATALGTEEEAQQRLEQIVGFLQEWEDEIAGYGYDTAPVVVHFHQQALARELGMNVVGVFGPAPLEARQIDEFTRMDPVLIVDNGHNRIASPLVETTDADLTVWYNFPGVGETRTLLDMFRLNRDELQAVVDEAR